MAYSDYLVRVLARALITKHEMGLGSPEDLVKAYPEAEQPAILSEIYIMRPDLQPASDAEAE
jgi:hypothetical protein